MVLDSVTADQVHLSGQLPRLRPDAMGSDNYHALTTDQAVPAPPLSTPWTLSNDHDSSEFRPRIESPQETGNSGLHSSETRTPSENWPAVTHGMDNVHATQGAFTARHSASTVFSLGDSETEPTQPAEDAPAFLNPSAPRDSMSSTRAHAGSALATEHDRPPALGLHQPHADSQCSSCSSTDCSQEDDSSCSADT